MIKTTAMILDELKDYASPKTKLLRLVRKGEYIPIVKGLYETDRNISPYLLAGSIYGPSYISFEFALSFHNLIPEAVYTVTCATFEKKKKKIYQTPFGTFSYRDIPSEAFPYCIQIHREGEYLYRMATPEKALCDQLCTIQPVQNRKEMEELLFDDLRIDETELMKFDRKIILELSKKYHSTNVKKLYALLRRL